MDSYSTNKGLHSAFKKGKILAKIEIFLNRWSVAQAGSNAVRNGGRKSCWTVPLSLQQSLAQRSSITCASDGGQYKPISFHVFNVPWRNSLAILLIGLQKNILTV